MSKRIGVLCLCLGIACLLSSVGFVAYNRWEADSAEESVRSLREELETASEDVPAHTDTPPETMATVTVGGYDCIGMLSVPALDLELPVLTDWSYAKLRKAPCLYYGTYYEENFVIAAHNYPSHFGRLSALQEGDVVVFTDVHGVAHGYEVVLLETLPKEATEAMIGGGFDLSLYTCTSGGSARVTVRCRAMTDNR